MRNSPLFELSCLMMAAVSTISALGCGGKIPQTNYYVLDIASGSQGSPDSTKLTATVGRLQASEMLLSDRLVYRESSNQVGFYEYHRWAEDPRTSITRAFVDKLKDKGTFAVVTEYDGRSRGDYSIQGRVERLEEVDGPTGVSARVSLRLSLVSEEDHRTVWESTATAEEPIAERNVSNLVARLSKATESVLDQLCGRLDAYVRASASERQNGSR